MTRFRVPSTVMGLVPRTDLLDDIATHLLTYLLNPYLHTSTEEEIHDAGDRCYRYVSPRNAPNNLLELLNYLGRLAFLSAADRQYVLLDYDENDDHIDSDIDAIIGTRRHAQHHRQICLTSLLVNASPETTHNSKTLHVISWMGVDIKTKHHHQLHLFTIHCGCHRRSDVLCPLLEHHCRQQDDILDINMQNFAKVDFPTTDVATTLHSCDASHLEHARRQWHP